MGLTIFPPVLDGEANGIEENASLIIACDDLFDRVIERHHCSQDGQLEGEQEMLTDWNILSDELQLALAAEALRRAAETIACQAETFAEEMDDGAMPDAGGPNALRLLAKIIRLNGVDTFELAGRRAAHLLDAYVLN